MPKYRAENQTLETYVRASRVIIENPLPHIANPHIHYTEALVSVDAAGNERIMDTVGAVVESFKPENQDTVFDLIHPVTGDVIGQSSYTDLQVLIYSLYFYLANERDVAKQLEEASARPAPEDDEEPIIEEE